jgi:hypothetical protein
MPANMVVPFEARLREAISAGSLGSGQSIALSTQEMIPEYREGVKFRQDDGLLALWRACMEEKAAAGLPHSMKTSVSR